MGELSAPRIVCAANRYPSPRGLIVVPSPRHLDRLMREIVMSLGFVGMQRDQFEEGFIDQHGVFYDRREAYKIAAANGQIRRRVGGDAADGGTLYSENLY